MLLAISIPHVLFVRALPHAVPMVITLAMFFPCHWPYPIKKNHYTILVVCSNFIYFISLMLDSRLFCRPMTKSTDKNETPITCALPQIARRGEPLVPTFHNATRPGLRTTCGIHRQVYHDHLFDSVAEGKFRSLFEATKRSRMWKRRLRCRKARSLLPQRQ